MCKLGLARFDPESLRALRSLYPDGANFLEAPESTPPTSAGLTASSSTPPRAATCSSVVIPAKTGIQVLLVSLDPGFRRGDDICEWQLHTYRIGTGSPAGCLTDWDPTPYRVHTGPCSDAMRDPAHDALRLPSKHFCTHARCAIRNHAAICRWIAIWVRMSGGDSERVLNI